MQCSEVQCSAVQCSAEQCVSMCFSGVRDGWGLRSACNGLQVACFKFPQLNLHYPIFCYFVEQMKKKPIFLLYRMNWDEGGGEVSQ